MTTEKYLELTKGLRGQLETGFVFDPTTINAESVPDYLHDDQRKFRPPPGEDLSWMNPPGTVNHQKYLKAAFAGMTIEQRRKRVAGLRANASKQKREHKPSRHGQRL